MEILRTLVILLATVSVAHAELAALQWNYTLEKPGADWQTAQFDDSSWQEGHSGFGTPSEGSRISTKWTTKNIWLRRELKLDTVPAKPALFIYHDEDAEVYLNGKKIASFAGYTNEYKVWPLTDAACAALKTGTNLFAVHCRQTVGGQGIDVHLIDADNVPELPTPKRPERPYRSELITEWGENVTPENAWQEYPRPMLVRESYTNLNGEWDYAITSKKSARPAKWQGKILVPFAVESKLSGVERLLHENKALWYHRDLDLQASGSNRMILTFEACDYQTEVWVNSTKVGSHTGGNTPFSFDVTDALADSDNELFVRVLDSTGKYQLRGKQIRNPNGIWYTQVSGIWGTVWAEEVASSYAEDIKISAKNNGQVSVSLDIEGDNAKADVTIKVLLAGKTVATATGNAAAPVQFKVNSPELWSPTSPTLYDLEVTVGEDSFKSYFGFREVGQMRDANGDLKFTLNGKEIFHWGPLDQGWWPDGLLTPPSEDAMRWDVDYLKAAGFNMIRKHIKVEPRSYYGYCDKIGMLVWQDQVSAGHGPPWSQLAPNPTDAVWPKEAHTQYMVELERMIDMLENHPSIVVWVPFNEAWGQHQTVEVGDWVVKRDPTRQVNVSSGGNFWPSGHIVDRHNYPHPSFPFHFGKNGRFDDYIKVVGEFGGHALPVEGHLWKNSEANWGYGGLPKNAAEYKERYVESIRVLGELQKKGIAGGVYTQTTDVEGEINGFITYDRKSIKLPAAELKKIHERLLK